MKKIITSTLLVAFGALLSYGSNIYLSQHTDHGAMAEKSKKPLYWVAPMDPNFKRDKPGKSPMGMDLVPVYEESGSNSQLGDVKVNSTLQSNFAIQTAVVTEGAIVKTVNTVANVEFNDDLISHIHPRVAGWIQNLEANSLGMEIKKGDRLFTFYSPDLLAAEQDYLTALRSGQRKVISAAKQRLTLMGISESEFSRLTKTKEASDNIPVYSDVDGIVSELNVREGMYINPGMDVMTIAGLSSIWLEGQLFEKQALWVKKGQEVEITFDSNPGQQFTGTVDFVDPFLDPKSRTVAVRVILDNTNNQFKPGMFANITIDAGESEKGLLIPREALIKRQNQNHVIVQTDDEHFQSMAVKSGIGDDSHVLILDGLNKGEKVVTSGQFLIDSESNIDASRLRMEGMSMAMKHDNTSENGAKTASTHGFLSAVDTDFNSLTIKHDPIPQWKWPTMTMDFELAPPLMINAVKVNQDIDFTIKRDSSENLLITQYKQAGMDYAVASGEIKGIDTDFNSLTIVHQPVAAWQWPAMTMDFELGPNLNIKDFAIGQSITFAIRRDKEMNLVITAIKTKE
ncbi:efflux RND transporter periplasmic adaptor subunit (plasmid) [Vibrio sp. SS-MA-C1-2]|uniref:efflux RND transporter periplasmic adaptor subunit n=1 Tax=Vibrio sp. SS-MA-C1-2 TaxID=2908646 RepID=UPI001F449FBE|nr:efflux RND transporter periplasmic adaptor subunit [Vibrio sp. SS-MA-C1-2]UJF20368.1 efflux RND transporter periplasmic adaptor subunit [Vibrio sp. SS-MA-C1-2]